MLSVMPMKGLKGAINEVLGGCLWQMARITEHGGMLLSKESLVLVLANNISGKILETKVDAKLHLLTRHYREIGYRIILL